MSVKLNNDILGKSNPRTEDSKDKMEKYRRAVTERNVAIAREQRQIEEKRRLQLEEDKDKDLHKDNRAYSQSKRKNKH